jgi:hypothetical protein
MEPARQSSRFRSLASSVSDFTSVMSFQPTWFEARTHSPFQVDRSGPYIRVISVQAMKTVLMYRPVQ